MEDGEGLLTVSFLVVTVPDGEGDGGFLARKLSIVRIFRLETPLENDHPAIIAPVTTAIDILVGLGGEGAESFGIEVFHRGPTQGIIGKNIPGGATGIEHTFIFSHTRIDMGLALRNFFLRLPGR